MRTLALLFSDADCRSSPPSYRLSAADRQSKMRLGSEGTHARDGKPSGF